MSAADGPMPQTREHILLARQVCSLRFKLRDLQGWKGVIMCLKLRWLAQTCQPICSCTSL